MKYHTLQENVQKCSEHYLMFISLWRSSFLECGCLWSYSTTTSRCLRWCWMKLMTRWHLSCRPLTADYGRMSERWKLVTSVSLSSCCIFSAVKLILSVLWHFWYAVCKQICWFAVNWLNRFLVHSFWLSSITCLHINYCDIVSVVFNLIYIMLELIRQLCHKRTLATVQSSWHAVHAIFPLSWLFWPQG